MSGRAPIATIDSWIEVVPAPDGSKYTLTVVERDFLTFVPNAEQMFAVLNRGERLDLYPGFVGVSAEFAPSAAKVVAAIASLMKAHPKLALTIEGHSEKLDSAEEARKLSVARAQAIVKALVGAGVAESRLSARGGGMDAPKVDSRSPLSSLLNRRIELAKTE
jgi:OOP family OmpA-OmpF porin